MNKDFLCKNSSYNLLHFERIRGSAAVALFALIILFAIVFSSIALWAKDFIVVTDDTAHIYTLLSNGDGTFGSLTEIDNLSGKDRGAAMGDFDGDSYLDLIAGNGSDGKINPYFYKGNVDGTFQAGVLLPPTSGSEDWMMGATAGDFDLDGKLDYVVNGDSGKVGFYWGNGDGTFSQETRTYPPQGRDMDTGDFDEDGIDDLIRGTKDDGIVRLYLSNGDRTFSDELIVGDAGVNPYGVVAGDFDEDGHLDVLASYGDLGDVTFFAGNGDGTFQAGVPRAELDLDNYSAMDAFDFDGDDHLDVVMTAHSNRSIYFWSGIGNGSFGTRTTLSGSPISNSLGISTPPLPPRVDVNIDQRDPVISLGDSLTLTAVGSDVLPGDTFEWNLGDGTTATGQTITHIYTQEGPFVVHLFHTNAAGIRSGRGTMVTVQGSAPVADTGGPYEFGEDTADQTTWTATLDASGSSDDFGIAEYEWDFGDGTTGNGVQVTHTWDNPGPWTVTLKVTDTSHQQSSDSTTVTFTPGAPPAAAITAPAVIDETTASVGVWSANFSAEGSSDDVGIWKYEWDFGNGQTDTGFSVSTSYTAMAVYTVTLTVTDHAGQTEVATHEVNVVGNDPPVAIISASTTIVEGVQPFLLSMAQSTDDFGILSHRWFLPARVFNFPGRVLDASHWKVTKGISQNDRLLVTGNDTWGETYLFSLDTRVLRGAVFEARVDTPSDESYAMVGLKNLNFGSGHYDQLVYAIYFRNGAVRIYEKGNNRGDQSSYSKGTSYDIRIETKAESGAKYFIRPSGTGASYELFYDSDNYTDEEFSFGADVMSGAFGFDDLRVDNVFAEGAEITASVSPPG
ncbi:VCBS repeat-containing protein, partial [bacterium]|nr:VCBS repeat-containing protein [bacterium]